MVRGEATGAIKIVCHATLDGCHFTTPSAMKPPMAEALIAAGCSDQIDTILDEHECPKSSYVCVAPRSGLAAKHGIDTLAGVIDSDYRGNVGVVLINHENATAHTHQGQRIAQLIVEKD